MSFMKVYYSVLLMFINENGTTTTLTHHFSCNENINFPGKRKNQVIEYFAATMKNALNATECREICCHSFMTEEEQQEYINNFKFN